MNQTEQIAQSALETQHRDLSQASFAPASALANRIKIDFKKLQPFKGKTSCFLASGPLANINELVGALMQE